MVITPHTQKLMLKGQIDWKRTDGRTDVVDCFTFPANAVCKTPVTIHAAEAPTGVYADTQQQFVFRSVTNAERLDFV